MSGCYRPKADINKRNMLSLLSLQWIPQDTTMDCFQERKILTRARPDLRLGIQVIDQCFCINSA